MHHTISERLKRIQVQLGVEPDGVFGGETLTALEKRLLPVDARLNQREETLSVVGMTLSQKGIDLLVEHEVSSEAYYRARLTRPTWPGGDSGVTIGIGYDLGYTTSAQFDADWRGLLSDLSMLKLRRVCGVKKASAKRQIPSLRSISVPFEAAKQVFTHVSLPAYARKTQKAYPGVENLKADAQAALVSLVYNRGASFNGDSRREMAAIRPLVQRKAYAEIAEQIISMKRLWEDRGLDGLLRRREDEAHLIRHAQRDYLPEELVRVA